MSWLSRLFGGNSESEKRSLGEGESFTLNDHQALKGLLSRAGISVDVTVDNAMSIAAFFGCVRVISNLIASQPLKLHKELPKGGSDVEKEHPLYFLLKHRMNSQMGPLVGFRAALINFLTRGFVILEIKRDYFGDVSEIIPIASKYVKIRRDITTGWYFFEVLENGRHRVLSEDDVIFLKDISEDGTCGRSIINWQHETLEIDLLASSFARKYYKNGAFMTGFLSNVTNTGDKEEGLKKFKADFVGSINSPDGYGLAVLKADAKWNPVTRPPIESQQVELFDKSAADIAMMFGIPLALLGNTEKQTSWGTGVEQMFIGVTRTVLIPIAIQIEQEINYKCLSRKELLDGYYTKFNFQALLRGSSKDFAEYVRILNEMGAMNEDEIRALDDKPPLPNGTGQRNWKNGAYVPMDMVDKVLEAKQMSNGVNGKKVLTSELQ